MSNERSQRTIAVLLVSENGRPVTSHRLDQIRNALQLISQCTAVQFRIVGLIGAQAYDGNSQPGLSTYFDLNEALKVVPTGNVLVADTEFSFRETMMRMISAASGQGAELFSETAASELGRVKSAVCTAAQFGKRIALGEAVAPASNNALLLNLNELPKSLVEQARPSNIEEFVAVLANSKSKVRQNVLSMKYASTPPSYRAIGTELLKRIRFWWTHIKFPGEPETQAKLTGLQQMMLWGGVFLFGWFIVARGLDYPLFEPDESRNAQIALNITQTGEWMSLKLAGEPYWDKPPLTAWLMAASYQIFGVSEFSTRLPGNLAAMATIMMVFGIGRRLVGNRAAAMGAGCLALSVGFVACGRYVTMDSILTCLATATLGFAYLATRGKRFQGQMWMASAIAGALGLLAKGPVVVVVTLPVLVAQHLLTGNRMLLYWQRWLTYSAIVLVVAGPWYLATALVHPDFLEYFFWKHHVMRFSEAFNHNEPWWYYVPVLFLVMFPASYLLPSVGRWIWSNQPEWSRTRSLDVGFLVLSAGWVLLFFSCAEAKLPTYILPAFPALALLMGVMLEQRLVRERITSDRRWWLEQIPTHAARMMGIMLIAAVIFNLISMPGWEWLRAVGAVAVGVLGSVLFLFAHNPFQRRQVRWASVTALSALALATIFQQVVPVVSEYRSTYVAAEEIKKQLEYQDVPIVFYEHEDYGASFWLQGRKTFSFTDAERHRMSEFLERNRRVLIVSRGDEMGLVQRTLKWPLCISEVEGARRLFLCDEREPETTEPRIADRFAIDKKVR
ncbi:MAG: glycosyltransferase family 39 protein [Pirellulaceae bacterium]